MRSEVKSISDDTSRHAATRPQTTLNKCHPYSTQITIVLYYAYLDSISDSTEEETFVSPFCMPVCFVAQCLSLSTGVPTSVCQRFALKLMYILRQMWWWWYKITYEPNCWRLNRRSTGLKEWKIRNQMCKLFHSGRNQFGMYYLQLIFLQNTHIDLT
jgi:hypothetical protein